MLVTAEEKNALDEYYVRNASLMLDAKIIYRTLKTVLLGDRRDASLNMALQKNAEEQAPSLGSVNASADPAAQ